jgi:hypothetical protein
VGWWPTVRALLGIGALFSGAALLAYLLARVALPLALAFTTGTLAVAVAFIVWRSNPVRRRRIALTALAGGLAGIAATLAYDASKFVLSHLDPSPFDPFEATRQFGLILVGQSAGEVPTLVAGWAFHLLNGTSFGVAYTFLFGLSAGSSRSRALLSGIAWGLFLEAFQLLLYPGWLGITLVAEFTRISAASHVVYGALLAIGVRAFLMNRWWSSVDADAEEL